MRNKHTYFFYDLKKFRDDRNAEVNCLGRKDEMSKRKRELDDMNEKEMLKTLKKMKNVKICLNRGSGVEFFNRGN